MSQQKCNSVSRAVYRDWNVLLQSSPTLLPVAKPCRYTGHIVWYMRHNITNLSPTFILHAIFFSNRFSDTSLSTYSTLADVSVRLRFCSAQQQKYGLASAHADCGHFSGLSEGSYGLSSTSTRTRTYREGRASIKYPSVKKRHTTKPRYATRECDSAVWKWKCLFTKGPQGTWNCRTQTWPHFLQPIHL